MRDEYVARINRVVDHIQDHLQEELTLESLARIACFSPYHFHRIFRSIVGEPLHQFIKRVRLERAASHLIWAPQRPITEIALDAGFASPAAFARAFRDRFGMSASEYRTEQESKNGQAMRKPGNAGAQVEIYVDPGAWAPKWRVIMQEKNNEVNVEVKELPERTIAYLRHTGPYQGNAELFGRLFGQLAQWAGPRGLLGPQTQFLSVYHDDPATTEPEKLRLTCALVVPPDTDVQGEIGKSTVLAGRYAVGHFELSTEEFTTAWDTMYADWLPASGYQPDDRPPMELYLNDASQHPEKKHIVEICVPVKPL